MVCVEAMRKNNPNDGLSDLHWQDRVMVFRVSTACADVISPWMFSTFNISNFVPSLRGPDQATPQHFHHVDNSTTLFRYSSYPADPPRTVQRSVQPTAPADFTQEMRSAACHPFARWHRSQSKSKSGKQPYGPRACNASCCETMGHGMIKFP